MPSLTGCLCLDWVLCLVALVTIGYLWVQKRYRYFADLGVPYLLPESFLSNNLFGAFMPDTTVGEVYDSMYKQLAPHPYAGFFHLLSPTYLIRDPELVTKFLVTEFGHFNDHGLPADEELNPLEGNLFFLGGPKWRALRRKLTPTFTSGKLKWMFDLIRECGDRLIETLDTEQAKGGHVEMKEILARFTTDVIGSCAFGLDSEAMKDPDSEFRRMGRKFFNPSLVLKIKTVFRFAVPRLYKMLKIKSGQPDVEQFFSSIIKQTIDHRLKTGQKRNDLVQLLLQLRETGSIEYEQDELALEDKELQSELNDEPDQIKFTDGLLTAQAFVFFVAGFETTASAISYSLYLMARHKEVQDRARYEVRERKLISGGEITYEALRSMTYLESCIDEALRIYPPIHLLPRICTKDFTMDDGTLIKKGQRLIIPIYSLHRDPKNFPDPEEFRPERFAQGTARKSGAYLPFGDGPRTCMGTNTNRNLAGLNPLRNTNTV
ncbi:hypothetical protein AAG570_004927 [Ranatra chinensis]|uniref:Cytochrome P450 n=1 Tax=Ranatra chinensis TaxID=642074 RepID=A0ABD0XYY7_9HEMI